MTFIKSHRKLVITLSALRRGDPLHGAGAQEDKMSGLRQTTISVPRKEQNMAPTRRVYLVLGLTCFTVATGAVWWFTPRPDDPLGPLPYRTKLVRELKRETIEQAVQNLANFDDVGWVGGVLTGSIRSYQRHHKLIPSMNRVRRLLQHGQANPGHGLDLVFMRELKASLDGYDKALEDSAKAYKEAKGGYVRSHPDDFDKAMVIGAASIYLLGEFKVHRALPLMARAYMEKKPVCHLFTFYAMHRLATTHPTEGLSPEAAAALAEYKEKAHFIPGPVVKEVPAWDAAYEESDFRVVILQKDLSELYDRTQMVAFYPGTICVYERSYGYDMDTKQWSDLAPEITQLFPFLKTFIDNAYPPKAGP